MMSNSDDETLMQVKQSTPSKVRFADAAVPSKARAVSATPSTPNTDTNTVTSPSTDDFYTDAFNFALSEIFSSTLMTSKDAILKEIRVCILKENEDRFRQISPYIHSLRKDLHDKNGCVCVDDRIAIPNSIRPPMWRQSMQHTQGVGGWQIWRHMHGGRTYIVKS